MLKEPSWLRAQLDRLRPRLRPEFLIIGAQKAGTSALFKMLAHHPQILAPVVKEQHFFDKEEHYSRGLKAYLQAFPFVPLRGPAKVTFEATPSYLFVEQAAARIKEHLPKVKLIVVLRDPIRRAYSAWNMFRDFGNSPRQLHLHDPRTFAQAVDDELNGRTDVLAHRYLARGLYAPQLKRFFALFGRDQVLVIDHRKLNSDPAGVMQECCRFLGLRPFAGDPAFLRIRDNVRPYSEPLDPELSKYLRAYFAPHMAELQQLLGQEWDLLESAE